MTAAGARRQVWITRSQPGADATAGRLRARGRVPLIGPLLQVRPLPSPKPPPAEPALLAFTSANAVRAFADWTTERRWPAIAVGAATAQAARDAGFLQVQSADGDAAALADRIEAMRPQGLVLHPCAREAAGDLQGVLAQAGVRVRSLALYETLAVEALPPGVADALVRGGCDAVLLHSPKAARVLADLVTRTPAIAGAGLAAFGLSPACVAPLRGLAFAPVQAAAEPREALLLDLLG